MLRGLGVRFLPFLSLFMLFTHVTSGVILVVPDEKDWDESGRTHLFRMLEDHSILLNRLEPKKARSYVESNLSEKAFIQQEIFKQFPNKKVQIEDVPATLVDIAAFNKSLNCGEDSYDYEELADRNILEKTKRDFYFHVSKLVTSVIKNQKSDEGALQALFEDVTPGFKKNYRFLDIKKDLNSQNSLVKQGLMLERKALEKDSFVWFRATRGVNIENYGLGLDCTINQKSLMKFHSLDQKGVFDNMFSLSFGTSLLAGIYSDLSACAYMVAKGEDKFVYSLTLPKKSFLSEEWKGLWHMPKTHPAFQVFGSGERFHPRLNGSHLSGGFNYIFKYDNSIKYKDLTLLASRLLLENTTIVTPMSPTKKERFREVHQGLYNFLRGHEVRKPTKVDHQSSPSLSIKKQAPKPVLKPTVQQLAAKPTVQKQTLKPVVKPAVQQFAAKPTVQKQALKQAVKPTVQKQTPKPVAKPVVKKPLVKASSQKQTASKQVSRRPIIRKPVAQKPTTKSAHKVNVPKRRPIAKRVAHPNKKSTPAQSRRVLSKKPNQAKTPVRLKKVIKPPTKKLGFVSKRPLRKGAK
ncbi:MAG: hypothetical protein K2Y08_07875 [Alphaproteobacteria bacterium]|nr:hypothetical protein [Alphaproteobacteria bacterium]